MYAYKGMHMVDLDSNDRIPLSAIVELLAEDVEVRSSPTEVTPSRGRVVKSGTSGDVFIGTGDQFLNLSDASGVALPEAEVDALSSNSYNGADFENAGSGQVLQSNGDGTLTFGEGGGDSPSAVLQSGTVTNTPTFTDEQPTPIQFYNVDEADDGSIVHMVQDGGSIIPINGAQYPGTYLYQVRAEVRPANSDSLAAGSRVEVTVAGSSSEATVRLGGEASVTVAVMGMSQIDEDGTIGGIVYTEIGEQPEVASASVNVIRI